MREPAIAIVVHGVKECPPCMLHICIRIYNNAASGLKQGPTFLLGVFEKVLDSHQPLFVGLACTNINMNPYKHHLQNLKC